MSETTTARGAPGLLPHAATPAQWLEARYDRLVWLHREIVALDRAATRLVGTIYGATAAQAQARSAAHSRTRRRLDQARAERDALDWALYPHKPLPKGPDAAYPEGQPCLS